MEEIINEIIEKNEEEMLNSLASLIKIPSVYSEAKEGAPYGENAKAALLEMERIARNLGFETIETVDDKVVFIEYGSGDRLIGVFGHLDVVPAGNGWTYPPFGAEVHAGRMYGRGVVDNKGPILAALYALHAIKEAELPLGDNRIRIVAGTNEERGMDDMEHYVQKCGAPDAGFTPDGWFPMSFTERGINYYYLSLPIESTNDDAIELLRLEGGDILNMVPASAKASLKIKNKQKVEQIIERINTYCQSKNFEVSISREDGVITIITSGILAHSGTPHEGKNALSMLLMILDQLDFTGKLGQFFSFFSEKIGMTTDGSLLGIAKRDECGAVTLSLSKLTYENNVIDFIVNIRYPHTYRENISDDVISRFEAVGINVYKETVSPSYMYPKDHPLIRTLMSVYSEMTNMDPSPGNGGGTYAKVVPNIVCFGPAFPYPNAIDMCHRADESILLEEYLFSAKIYGQAMYALAVNYQEH